MSTRWPRQVALPLTSCGAASVRRRIALITRWAKVRWSWVGPQQGEQRDAERTEVLRGTGTKLFRQIGEEQAWKCHLHPSRLSRECSDCGMSYGLSMGQGQCVLSVLQWE